MNQQPTSMWNNVGPYPCTVHCPSCNNQVLTETKHTSNGCTHCWAICMFILVCPFFWIPYCTSCCRNTDHYCPNCKAFIGKYQRNN